jgi:hypothetical protein
MSMLFHTIGSVAKSACAVTLRFSGAKLAVAAAAGLMLAGTSAAQAHHRDFDGTDVVVAREVRCRPVGPEVRCQPVAPVVTEQERVWVPAVYRTVCDHVWHEAEYRTVCQKVFVPAVWEVREVRYYGGCRRERVQVCPAHYEDRQCQQLACAGHFEDVQRQELVCDGHWQIQNRFVVAERSRPVYEAFPRLEFRIGR